MERFKIFTNLVRKELSKKMKKSFEDFIMLLMMVILLFTVAAVIVLIFTGIGMVASRFILHAVFEKIFTEPDRLKAAYVFLGMITVVTIVVIIHIGMLIKDGIKRLRSLWEQSKKIQNNM